MMTIFRPLALSLLLASSIVSAADAPFYFIDIADTGKAVLYSESQRAPKGDLSYALVDRVSMGCCVKATARKPARKTDDDTVKFVADEVKPIFSHTVQFSGARKPEPDQAYGFEGMQTVTKKGRGTYQVTLQAGDPVFVRTCYSGEGMRVRLYHRLADRKPYASYYYYLGYDVEPTCR
ncbi:hypothetical protein NX786_09370 [Telluria mixta]|uniref:Uncharacterized protein n=1 Tax=Telluria mixta TaxID=34071 RepID=A0ABT2BWM7_9BURK|nr:hypothetical protein [Telluria mixta]MCS0629543.1 hypothetical protein [Telluria mixta]WEM96882.1 hypothetical protein P0M04_03840 [Telluria mixta]